MDQGNSDHRLKTDGVERRFSEPSQQDCEPAVDAVYVLGGDLKRSHIEFALLLDRSQPGVCRVQHDSQEFDLRPIDEMGLFDRELDHLIDGLVELDVTVGAIRAI